MVSLCLKPFSACHGVRIDMVKIVGAAACLVRARVSGGAGIETWHLARPILHAACYRLKSATFNKGVRLGSLG